jgi:hypothetical protein
LDWVDRAPPQSKISFAGDDDDNLFLKNHIRAIVRHRPLVTGKPVAMQPKISVWPIEPRANGICFAAIPERRKPKRRRQNCRQSGGGKHFRAATR